MTYQANQSEGVSLSERLRKLATGTLEWRVQHPVDKCYCISFSRWNDSTMDPEQDAREWLADFQKRWPHHPHAKYEVAEVRSFTDLERAALEAADALAALPPQAKAEPAGVSDEQIMELAKAHTSFNGSHAMTNYVAFARAILSAAPSTGVTTLEDADADRIHSMPWVRDCLLRYVDRPCDKEARDVVRAIVNAVNGLPVGVTPSDGGDHE